MPTPPDTRRFDHAEIAERYRRKRRRRRRSSLTDVRIIELDRIFIDRYGDELPDDDAGRDDVMIMAHHIAAQPGNLEDALNDWLLRRAPWYRAGELNDLIEELVNRPRRWKADKLAWRLRLTERDRKRLKINSIGAIDTTKAQRLARRRAANREAQRARRRQHGAKPRDEYLAEQTASPKPWKDLGISRATYYRRRRMTE